MRSGEGLDMIIDGNNFINGQWTRGGHHGVGAAFSSLNPATGETIWQGEACDAHDIDTAIKGLRQGFVDWSRTTFDARCEIVRAYAAQLQTHAEDLAVMIAAENGKPLWEARTEVSAMINKIEISIAAHKERTPDTSIDDAEGVRRLRHRPHGVVAVLGPFNFPGHLANGHIVPAILAGNVVAFKPSEQTPMVGEAMVRLWLMARLPKDVIALLQGGAETGRALTQHEDVNGLFFTGAADTGKAIHRQTSGDITKILALELGGNNPLVVHEVEDIEATALMVVQSAFLTAGQRCTCARRLIVVEGPKTEDLISAIKAIMARLRVGAFDEDPAPFMGPVISNAACLALMAKVDALMKLGAKAVVPLKRLKDNLPFLSPCLIDVTGLSVPDEELFGPVLQLIRVADFDAAMARANATRFGLAAGLLSDRPEHFEAFAQTIRAGIINWNRILPGASSAAPFGGIGDSGNHAPSAYYAADYCAYPVAGLESARVVAPKAWPIGIEKE